MLAPQLSALADQPWKDRNRIAWPCADSYSLRDFLKLSNREKVPDLSWLSRRRSHLPHEAHEKVFGWLLKLVAWRGLVKGERRGVDGSRPTAVPPREARALPAVPA